MKSADTDILVLPGHGGPAENHWQKRLIDKLPSATLLPLPDWQIGAVPAATAAVVDAVSAAQKPVVFVTHGAGATVLAHAIDGLRAAGVVDRVKGAFIVAPPAHAALKELRGSDPALAHVPRAPFPFPSLLVASTNDPMCPKEDAADLALAWGAQFVDAGEAGGLDAASGHGPWPEGMMRFAGFLSRL